MPKVLICASTIRHIRSFHLPYLAFFKNQGFEVHLAVPERERLETADVMHSVPITKRLCSLKNLAAVGKMRRIIKSEQFDLILVHTTLAAVVTRLGALLAGKKRPKLINTVHGYFFWNGCGIFKRIMYELPERLLRGVTDCIITMNNEDTMAAQRLVMREGSVFQVHGMGVDAARFVPAGDEERRWARSGLDIDVNDFVLVYPAEFSKRKNHIELIKAMAEIMKHTQNVLLLLCGSGALEPEIKEEVKRLGLTGNVRFLGWQSQMENIYKACDLAVSVSKSEGLPFNIIEAQLGALPVIASRIRGHIDLISEGITGWCYKPGDAYELANLVLRVKESPDRGRNAGTAARQSAMRFTLEAAYHENTEAYLKVLQL
jgi:glycosyltransferase EpsD